MIVIINGKSKNIRWVKYSNNSVTKKHTAFESFIALVSAKGGYRPSIYMDGKSNKEQRELLFLTHEYDSYQRRHIDSRRVYRADWSCATI